MRAARCACVALLAALAWAAPAGAAPDRVLVLTEDGRVRAHGAGLLPDTDAAAPHRASSARRRYSRRSAARRSRGPTAVAAKRKRRTVLRELKRLRLDDYAARRATWKDAKRRATGLDGTRASEMGAVIKIVKRIARRGDLSASRVAPLWLTVEQNLRWWSEGTIPSSGQRIEFEGSELVWQYYPGQGLALQMLGNFGKLNALWSSRRNRRLETMLDELLALPAERAGGLAWEYYFAFGGGSPPWVSGMAQGTAVQSLSRAATRLGREADVFPVASRALGIFETPTPEGVRVPGEAGVHYALYSYAPGLRIINGFAQALVGLYDYAELTGDPRGLALFEAGDREARSELPTFDTGAWSLYSRGTVTRESDLSYHQLLRGFVRNLCLRTDAAVYCDTAQHFLDYESIPPAITVRGRKLRGGSYGRVRFELSKLSSVSLTITRGSRVVESRAFGTVGYGKRTFGWDVPRRRGRYTVELRATDPAGNVASDTATVRVLRAKRARP